MGQDRERLPAHPAGEQPLIEQAAHSTATIVDSWAGPVRVEWDDTAALTPHGQMPFFIDYLKVAGVFDSLVADLSAHLSEPERPEEARRAGYDNVFDPGWA